MDVAFEALRLVFRHQTQAQELLGCVCKAFLDMQDDGCMIANSREQIALSLWRLRHFRGLKTLHIAIMFSSRQPLRLPGLSPSLQSLNLCLAWAGDVQLKLDSLGTSASLCSLTLDVEHCQVPRGRLLLPCLQHLAIWSTQSNPRPLRYLETLQCSSLRSLHVGDAEAFLCTQLPQAVTAGLTCLQLGRRCTDVLRLDDERPQQSRLAPLSSMTSLVQLRLLVAPEPWGDLSALGSLTRLEELELFCDVLSSQGLEFLGRLPRLRDFALGMARGQVPHGIQALASPCLTSLSFDSGAHLADEAIPMIACAPGVSTLRRLVLMPAMPQFRANARGAVAGFDFLASMPRLDALVCGAPVSCWHGWDRHGVRSTEFPYPLPDRPCGAHGPCCGERQRRMFRSHVWVGWENDVPGDLDSTWEGVGWANDMPGDLDSTWEGAAGAGDAAPSCTAE